MVLTLRPWHQPLALPQLGRLSRLPLAPQWWARRLLTFRTLDAIEGFGCLADSGTTKLTVQQPAWCPVSGLFAPKPLTVLTASAASRLTWEQSSVRVRCWHSRLLPTWLPGIGQARLNHLDAGYWRAPLPVCLRYHGACRQKRGRRRSPQAWLDCSPQSVPPSVALVAFVQGRDLIMSLQMRLT